jgi:laccase
MLSRYVRKFIIIVAGCMQLQYQFLTYIYYYNVNYNKNAWFLLLIVTESTYRWVVDYGKTYLVRIVNAAMNAELFFAIANHNLTVVGMDGNYVKPILSDYLVMSPGQTMDVLLTANQSLSHYYVAIRQYDSARPDVTNYDKTNATAILMYNGNYTAPNYPTYPSSTLPSYEDFRSADRFLDRLRSLATTDHPVNVPLNVTTKMYITVSMNQIICPNGSCAGINGNRLSSSLNNISFVNPTTDVLQAYYRYIYILTLHSSIFFFCL